MNLRIARSLAAASLVLGLSALVAAPAQAQAQGSSLTRAQVKMDRNTFLAMARWDESVGNWVLKDTVRNSVEGTMWERLWAEAQRMGESITARSGLPDKAKFPTW